jgi:AraC-like DNA-binding protein
LYYTNQLLKVNEGIRKDFAYLAEKIYEDFEIAELVKDKYTLEKSLGRQHILVTFAIVLSGILIIVLIWRSVRERDLRKRYADLQKKLSAIKQPIQVLEEKRIDYIRIKSELPDELVEKLTLKLQNFEDKKLFLEPGITAAKLADRFKTNATYLSTFIHESKALNFSSYITQLRIEYITEKLNSDRDYPKYTVQALAEMCGIASRNNFRDHFKRINGIGVGDFIKMKLKDNERDR